LEGMVYQKLGDIFEDPLYYRLAIKRFKFLVSDYGGNRNCPDALIRIEAIKSEVESPPRKSFPEAVSDQKTVPQTPAYAESEKNVTTVQNIQHLTSDDYTRLVIDLDSYTLFEKNLIRNPNRMYFDITNARLSEELQGKIFSIQDAFLKQIRVGQFTADIVRIVLDFHTFSAYSVSRLENPARIVIDLHKYPLEQEKIKTRPSVTSETPVYSQSPKEKNPPILESDDTKTFKNATVSPTYQASENAQLFAGKTVPLAELLDKDSPDPPKAAEPNEFGQRTLTRALGLKIGKIVIDPGHGGHDLGTVGPAGMLEKELVLNLALKLKKLLHQNLRAEVVLTREKDVFVTLEKRTEIANKNKADLFISIHANSSRYNYISGVETYYLDFAKTESERTVAARENAGTGSNINELEDLVKQITLADKTSESKELAIVIQNRLFSVAQTVFVSTQNRGVHSAPFIVLIGSKMPSVLTEVAFISNPRDEKKLNEEKNLVQLAEALFSGIETYMKRLGNYPIAYRTAPK